MIKILKEIDWPYKGKLTLSELDDIRDTIEEGFDYEIPLKNRYEFVAFLQRIIDCHSFEERQANVEVRMPLGFN